MTKNCLNIAKIAKKGQKIMVMTKNATNMVIICIDKSGEKMYTFRVGKSFCDYSARVRAYMR